MKRRETGPKEGNRDGRCKIVMWFRIVLKGSAQRNIAATVVRRQELERLQEFVHVEEM